MFSFLNKKNLKKTQNELKLESNADTHFGSLRTKTKKKNKQSENESEKLNKKNKSNFTSGYFTTGRLSKKKCTSSLGLTSFSIYKIYFNLSILIIIKLRFVLFNLWTGD